MKGVSISTLKELKKLQDKGFTSRLTQSSSDGSNIIVAENAEGLTRIFNVYELEDK